MTLRNIHAIPAAQDLQPAEALPRLRAVTNSPAREYAARPGQVERLPDALAACILAEKRWATVTRDQISLQINKRRYVYFSPDSVTIRATSEDRQVPVFFNRYDLSVIHVFTADGAYVETLAQKGKAEFFSTRPEAGRALADSRRVQDAKLDRLQVVHETDTHEAVARARHNADQVSKVIQTMPAAAPEAQPGTPSRFPRAERVVTALTTAAAATAARKADVRRAVQAHRRRQLQPAGATDE